MRTDWSHLDAFRIPHPVTGYLAKGDTVGCFQIPHHKEADRKKHLAHYNVIASDAQHVGWEHVSVHVRYVRDGQRMMRTPSWDEMCAIKDMFWEPTECVVQFHPPASSHINTHPHVLHLWRHVEPFAMPPQICV